MRKTNRMESSLISEYAIAAAENHKQLVDVMADQLADGWQPYGNIFQYQFGEQLLICQPMIKKAKASKIILQ